MDFKLLFGHTDFQRRFSRNECTLHSFFLLCIFSFSVTLNHELIVIYISQENLVLVWKYRKVFLQLLIIDAHLNTTNCMASNLTQGPYATHADVSPSAGHRVVSGYSRLLVAIDKINDAFGNTGDLMLSSVMTKLINQVSDGIHTRTFLFQKPNVYGSEEKKKREGSPHFRPQRRKTIDYSYSKWFVLACTEEGDTPLCLVVKNDQI